LLPYTDVQKAKVEISSIVMRFTVKLSKKDVACVQVQATLFIAFYITLY
jgi:hypothetical protein